MNVILGDKRRFAAEVGEQGQLRRLDLWAAGKWLTCDDNMAYVPQFRRDVLDTAAWLQSGEGFSMPFAGLSAEATHRRLMHRAGEDDETAADHGLRSQFQALLWGPGGAGCAAPCRACLEEGPPVTRNCFRPHHEGPCPIGQGPLNRDHG
ncbi:hypothetical protein OHA88_02165 [Streptomyces sp. NBC_00353]|uniref:hypothetical protein n=1 Tax=Streptomyces sp. NBC_00353 TaxID=2975722 RepID=UPI002E26651C